MHLKVPLAAALAILTLVPAVGAGGASGSLVEDHTAHAVITVGDEPPTLDVIGDVRCHVEVRDVRITVPPSVGRVGLDCGKDVTVYISGAGAPNPLHHGLAPTGRVLTTEGPQGERWTSTEHRYVGPQGSEHLAWTVDPGPTRHDPATGDAYRFVAPVPADELPGGTMLRLRVGPSP